MYTPERIYYTKPDYLTEVNLKDILDEVMEVIVGLLKDRIEIDDPPDAKSKIGKNILRSELLRG
jgi:hypothetical protein